MEKSPVFRFSQTDASLKCLKEKKDKILQYNLDQNLQITKYRFTGSVPKTTSDYDQLLADALSSATVLSALSISGSPSMPMELKAQQLQLTVTNLGFFDKLEESGASSSFLPISTAAHKELIIIYKF
jgi:hypothetical protein